ncbi:MAG: hypothetical protein WAK82_44385, partial [Streptosporangiaceae bacterium]
FAARLQAELEGLDWVCAEQKVAVAPDAADADAWGWAGGIGVSFGIRGGRMCTWQQRPCSAAAARRYLDLTPPAWAGFAQRAAELAARLTSCAG